MEALCADQIIQTVVAKHQGHPMPDGTWKRVDSMPERFADGRELCSAAGGKSPPRLERRLAQQTFRSFGSVYSVLLGSGFYTRTEMQTGLTAAVDRSVFRAFCRPNQVGLLQADFVKPAVRRAEPRFAWRLRARRVCPPEGLEGAQMRSLPPRGS